MPISEPTIPTWVIFAFWGGCLAAFLAFACWDLWYTPRRRRRNGRRGGVLGRPQSACRRWDGDL